MKQLDRDAMIDLLTGATVLGTGGGGDFDAGLRYVDATISAGRPIRLAGIDELPDDALTCMPYALGATRATPDTDARYTRLPRSDTPAAMIAMQQLARHLGGNFDATVACEMGGENTAVAAYAAAMSDAVLLDADTAGRAVPEVQHSTYYIHGLKPGPVALANEFGESLLCRGIFDDQRLEEIARSFAVVSRDDIAAVDHALRVGEIRAAIIPGTLTRAISLGAALREARSSRRDAASVIAEAGGGIVAFRGTVSQARFRTESGFSIGHIAIAGDGRSSYRIDVRNENMVAWLDGEIHATIPDLICVIDLDRCEPMTNPIEASGQRVAVVILPAPAPFTTSAGLAVFGPAYLGLEHAYASPI